MSLIRNAKGRNDGNSGYTRVLGNDELGSLISKIQATVISNGSELEKLIQNRCNLVPELNEFIDLATVGDISDGVYLCNKKTYLASRYVVTDNENKKIVPDMLVFIVERRRICKVIELKDGDSFDTKKSAGEKNHLELFIQKFGMQIPFVTEYYICCFNQEDKEIIYTGFKGDFDYNNILTGKELCDILKISYNEIVELRKRDAKENLEYFIDNLLDISEVKKMVLERLLTETNEEK